MDLFNDDNGIENAAAQPPTIDDERDRQTTNKVFDDDEELWLDDFKVPTVESAQEKFKREKRLAEQAHAKDVYVSSTPHEVLPSSSPVRPDFTSKKTKGPEGSKTKERRKPVILNEMTLIGPTGFPTLIQDMKGFKPKGKGHEVRLFLFNVSRSYASRRNKTWTDSSLDTSSGHNACFPNPNFATL